MTESDIQRDIIQYLEFNDWLVFRMNAGKGRVNQRLCQPGTPDLFCIRKGKAFWFEVKAPKGKVSDTQVKFHMRLINNGQKVYVVRSLDDVMEVIK